MRLHFFHLLLSYTERTQIISHRPPLCKHNLPAVRRPPQTPPPSEQVPPWAAHFAGRACIPRCGLATARPALWPSLPGGACVRLPPWAARPPIGPASHAAVLLRPAGGLGVAPCCVLLAVGRAPFLRNSFAKARFSKEFSPPAAPQLFAKARGLSRRVAPALSAGRYWSSALLASGRWPAWACPKRAAPVLAAAARLRPCRPAARDRLPPAWCAGFARAYFSSCKINPRSY